MLIAFQCESSSIEDCINEIKKKSEKTLKDIPGSITSAKITLTFGAFMNLLIVLNIDECQRSTNGILAEFSSGRNKEDAITKVLDVINGKIPKNAQVIEFELKTYTTPVTRRTYAVAVAVYNIPEVEKPLLEYSIQERRRLLASVLKVFNYNPRVLNISEIARMFGVSRDSIYYDIGQILKEVGKTKRSR